MTEAHDEASAKIASSGSKQNGDESAVGYQIIIRDLNEEIARQTEATKKLQSENDDLRGEVDGMRTVSQRERRSECKADIFTFHTMIGPSTARGDGRAKHHQAGEGSA